MRKTIWASMMALAAFTAGSEARAQQQWGLHTGDTVRTGDNMIYGEFGWPSLNIGFAHGLNDKVDIGALFVLPYGFEYRPDAITVGLGLRVPIRITPLRTNKVSLQIHVDPGIKFDSFDDDNHRVLFGLWIPFGIEVGIHLTREATLSFGMEVPFYLNVTDFAYGGIPLLFGPGFEYHIDDHIGLGLNTKFGPSIVPKVNPVVDFGFIVQANFVYRI
jgi:hypothetical protein